MEAEIWGSNSEQGNEAQTERFRRKERARAMRSRRRECSEGEREWLGGERERLEGESAMAGEARERESRSWRPWWS